MDIYIQSIPGGGGGGGGGHLKKGRPEWPRLLPTGYLLASWLQNNRS